MHKAMKAKPMKMTRKVTTKPVKNDAARLQGDQGNGENDIKANCAFLKMASSKQVAPISDQSTHLQNDRNS